MKNALFVGSVHWTAYVWSLWIWIAPRDIWWNPLEELEDVEFKLTSGPSEYEKASRLYFITAFLGNAPDFANSVNQDSHKRPFI